MIFIQRSGAYSTLESSVPAPCFRRSFLLPEQARKATLQITAPGFYRVFVNGKEITKGFLAPYRSNLDHYIYYDEYALEQLLVKGKNVIACIAGDGWKNPVGGYTWGFDRVHWRGAPQVAFSLQVLCCDGQTVQLESDEKTLTAPSPIVFNDLHIGEHYDARLELPGWQLPEYDDRLWEPAQRATPPAGQLRLCRAEPVVAAGERKAVSITAFEEGFIYDFGENNAGLCRLQIEGSRGQRLVLRHAETLVEGKPFFDSIRFTPDDPFQEDVYICRGGGTEVYMPSFTYHGFRYVYITGITPAQATGQLLTYVLLHSDLKQVGQFCCDDPVINKLQQATVRSDISNFHYFPTDCPHREKNGWTGDASLSAEQFVLNFDPGNSYRQWLENVCRAMTEEGELPGMVPTTGFGYTLPGGPARNGPAWDGALINLPYYSYVYRNDVALLQQAAPAIERYLQYLQGKRDSRGLLAFGLGDWCQPRRSREGDYTTPLVVTDSIVATDIAAKAAQIYKVLGMTEQAEFAAGMYEDLRNCVRKHLIDRETGTVYGATQTGQAIALAYGMFEEGEKEKAVNRLLALIGEKDGFMDTGVIGARVLFRVLADHGYADLALQMITRPEYPSYGNWIARGATTLWEGFWENDQSRFLSMNHHFWGDISAWFYIYLAGIRVLPGAVTVKPCFVKRLNRVKASCQLPEGKITVQWERTEDGIELEVTAPEAVSLTIDAPGAQIKRIGY